MKGKREYKINYIKDIYRRVDSGDRITTEHKTQLITCLITALTSDCVRVDGTRKLLWFEITKMLIAVLKITYCAIYYNFRHTFVPYD